MIVIALAVLATLVAATIAYGLARSIAGGVRRMQVAAQSIAVGDLQQDVTTDSCDEIGQMAAAFRDMIEYLHGMANAAEAITVGDLSVEVSAKSERDVLGNAFVSMQGYLGETASAAEQIAGGNLTVRVTPKSPRDSLGSAFAVMIQRLHETLSGAAATADRLADARTQLARSAD